MDNKITKSAKIVLERRYFLKDDNGKIFEDWDKLTKRVGYFIAKNDPIKGKQFKDMIFNMDFLPNSPCLMNAGIKLGQLSACFVISVEDNMKSIFKAVSDAALINKSGGGVGYSFSKLREKNSTVSSTQGVASGPLSFIKVFDVSTDIIKQGGRRRGANMGVLNIDHPDIKEFIQAKEIDGEYSNFNFSVNITDEFMKKVQNNETYWTISPQTGKKIKELNASEIWQLLVEKAWIGGDPGVLFVDAANRANVVPHLGKLEATNPCLTGDTIVKILLNNKEQDVTIKEVVNLFNKGSKIKILSLDIKNNKKEFKNITSAALTRKDTKILKITDSETGITIKATPDHLIYTKNRGYVKAKNLKNDDQLYTCGCN